MDFWLFVCLVLLIAPFMVIIGLEWLPLGKHIRHTVERKNPSDGLRELNTLLRPPHFGKTIVFNDVSLVNHSNQKLETGLGLEKKMTGPELKEYVEQLPHNFIHYSKDEWINRYWIQKVKSSELELFNGRKVPHSEENS